MYFLIKCQLEMITIKRVDDKKKTIWRDKRIPIKLTIGLHRHFEIGLRYLHEHGVESR